LGGDKGGGAGKDEGGAAPVQGSSVQAFKVGFGWARGTGSFKGSTIKLFVPFQ